MTRSWLRTIWEANGWIGATYEVVVLGTIPYLLEEVTSVRD